ncbi:hypothetical protein VNI00_017566 [Paramarasmius palmivorus]|uniref:Uncharacterized protein n=1 Tax=Paramarasmius palmivorus TaxID=297713 RepID=A0AAW0B4V8_9AGAR
MPRAKIYRTQAEVKQAKRQKSARYYQKNRDKILSKLQQQRDEVKKQEDIEFIERLRKKRIKKWNEDQKDLAGVIEDHDPLARIKVLNHSLIRLSGGRPSAWMDTIYHHYVRVRGHDSTRRTASPIDQATTSISNLLRGASIFSDRILNSYGGTDFYKRAAMFCKRLRWIIACLEDMELRVMDPEDDLVKAYEEKRLNFQQDTTRDWIDGVVPIPE